MSGTVSWAGARRILAIRADNLGDVLMTTPALRALRDSAAGRHITLLTSKAGSSIAAMVPELDQVIASASLPWMPGSNASVRQYAELVDELKREAFDAAVIFTVYSQSPLPAAMLCWQAGIPLRLAHCRENPYSLLTHWVEEPEPHSLVRHEVRRQLDLVASIGAVTDNERLSVSIDSVATVSVVKKLSDAGIDVRRPWLIVHPGATAPSRRYPVPHYAQAIRQLIDAEGHQVVLTGDASESALVDAILAGLGPVSPAVVSLCGKLTLAELVALISRASTLVANNTGPVHIAAAVGTPVVDIYALTNPQHAPWQVPCRVLFHDVPCRFCYRSTCPRTHHECLNLLDPQRVSDAARELLELGADRSIPGVTPVA
jgi:lipopolysaccharide heptosyltransferase II